MLLKRLVDAKLLANAALSYKQNLPTTDNDTTFVGALRDQLTSVSDILVSYSESLEKETFQWQGSDRKKTLGCGRRRPHRLVCPRCKKQFSTQSLLTAHIKNVHEGMVKQSVVVADLPFQCCQLCYACYRDPADFDRFHICAIKTKAKLEAGFIDSHDILTQHNRFSCGYCGEDFRYFDRIKHHLSKCRGGPFACELCPEKDFSDRKSLNSHKLEKHPKDSAFLCDECPKRFKLNNALQKHIANHHARSGNDGEVKFSCEHCGKRFLKRLYLTNHQTRFHALFKPFLCHICGEGFVSSSGLKSHQSIHDDGDPAAKRFSCSYCSKSFRRRDKLSFHEAAAHTGHRPHVCETCGHGFVRKSKLDEHQRRRHGGEKRFSCLVCRKMYAGSHDLRRHLVRHHPDVDIRPNEPLTPQIIGRMGIFPVSRDDGQQPKANKKVTRRNVANNSSVSNGDNSKKMVANSPTNLMLESLAETGHAGQGDSGGGEIVFPDAFEILGAESAVMDELNYVVSNHF